MQSELIISIDGGGIRGIIPLLILQEIESKSIVSLKAYDPNWWGTSTGALISAAINVQEKVNYQIAIQNVLDLYEFRSASAINPQGSSIPARALMQLIQANFSQFEVKDFPKLNLVASNALNLNPVIFNAYNSCQLSDAILASCAYPGIFPSVRINGVDYVDGYFKAKNPSLLAVNAALSKGKKPIVISIGTGDLHIKDEIEKYNITINDQLLNLHETGAIFYYRLNPVLSKSVDAMQNVTAKNIYNLRKDTMSFLQQSENQIQKILKTIEAELR